MSEVTMNLIQPAEVVRDEYGFWTHPDYPEWDEGTTRPMIDAWFKEQGLERSIIWFEEDAPRHLVDEWMENGEAPCEKWEPTVPEGGGWFVLSIHDTEDGPLCIWVCRETSA